MQQELSIIIYSAMRDWSGGKCTGTEPSARLTVELHYSFIAEYGALIGRHDD